MHLPAIVQDLAVILVVAAVMTILFRAIKQPVVLGYIVAGFMVGPHFKWLPDVLDHESVKVWAEIGVIFLLFSLGLEFSFKKLARVGAPASITAVLEVVGMVGIGFVIGKVFGWSVMDSLFLGGILAISSTTIIIRAFQELGLKGRGFVSLVFGVLIVEDLVAILLMVMLSTVAVTRSFSGYEMLVSAGKLVFFLTLWFVAGIFLIPSFLKRTRKMLGEETLLVVAVGLCFLMVVLASQAGFSAALGAFIMGSILAETLEGERIEHLILPVKDLFGAVFFVSVGMLIDPQVLVTYAAPIAVITIATILGKVLTTATGALLSGQTLRHSVQAGMSLAQIGEFSFIIASLGLSLKVTSDFLYPIAISVSAVTTFTTPYLIKSTDKLVEALEKHLPTGVLQGLETWRLTVARRRAGGEENAWFKRMALRLVANGVVVLAIFLIADRLVVPRLEAQFPEDQSLARNIGWALAATAAAPFLWALTYNRLGGERLFGAPYRWLENRFVVNLNEKDQAQKMPPLAPWDAHLAKVRVSPDSSLVGRPFKEAQIRERFGVTVALIQRGHKTIPAPGPDACLFPGDLLNVIGTDEQIHGFQKVCEEEMHEVSKAVAYGLQPHVIGADSPYAGRTIRESGLREATQGLVVGIEKAGRRILNPESALRLEAGDVLWIVGNRDLMGKTLV